MSSKSIASLLLFLISFLVIVLYFSSPPIPQPETYHHFADQREWLGLANASNVLSNSMYALAGIWGLCLLANGQLNHSREGWLWYGVSLGLILTAFGSAYYHLAPDNDRLLWDRLAMTIIFMSLVALLIGERINLNLALWLWPVLLGIGFYSVIYWYKTELRGAGDLRAYIGVQVFTVLLILEMLFVPSPYHQNNDLCVVLILFLLARGFEFYDHQIFQLSGETVSGHTLKHLTSGLAGIWLIRMLSKRRSQNAD